MRGARTVQLRCGAKWLDTQSSAGGVVGHPDRERKKRQTLAEEGGWLGVHLPTLLLRSPSETRISAHSLPRPITWSEPPRAG
jgi:hypothetical protein